MTVSAFTYSGSELDALADARNYYGAILDSFAPHLGDHVVEVGAGIGTFASMLLARSAPSALTLIEPAANNFPHLLARFADDPRVRLLNGYLDQHADGLEATSVVMVNVAEHVSDDLELFRAARRALRPNGTLLLFVPAFMQLFGSLDEAFEHYRRYTREGVRARLVEAGFAPSHVHYVNSVGVVPWFVAGRILRRRTLRKRDVTLYDRFVTPWVSRIERRWRPPFGQSVLAVARR